MQGELQNGMHMDVTVRPDGTEAVTLSKYGAPVLLLSRPRVCDQSAMSAFWMNMCIPL